MKIRSICVVALAAAVLMVGADAQGSTRATRELGVQIQGGVGLQDRSDYRFFNVGAHAGKILTSDLGSGLFKGNFE